jgi:hypothetical protein
MADRFGIQIGSLVYECGGGSGFVMDFANFDQYCRLSNKVAFAMGARSGKRDDQPHRYRGVQGSNSKAQVKIASHSVGNSHHAADHHFGALNTMMRERRICSTDRLVAAVSSEAGATLAPSLWHWPE